MTEWIVSASVLIAVMAVLRRVLKGKVNPRLQYALWAIVLVRLLIPVSFFESGLSVQNVRSEVMDTPQVQQVYTAVTAPIPVENYDRVYREVVREFEAQGVDVAEMEPSDVETEVYSRMDTISVQEVLYMLWIAGMAVMAAALIGCNARFALRLRRSREALDVAYSPIPVYRTNVVETPCLFGLFWPTIYLTPEAAEDEQVKRYVLTHEITHYQQFDHIWAALRAVCLVLHWYNPLVWLAFRLSRQDGEMACDEGTLRLLGEEHRGNYGRTLIALATQTRLRGSLVAATTMADGKRAIKERIVILMKNPKTAFVTMIALILVCTLVVGCTFTGSIEGEIKENGEGTEPVQTSLSAEATEPSRSTEPDETTPPAETTQPTNVRTPILEEPVSMMTIVEEDQIYYEYYNLLSIGNTGGHGGGGSNWIGEAMGIVFDKPEEIDPYYLFYNGLHGSSWELLESGAADGLDADTAKALQKMGFRRDNRLQFISHDTMDSVLRDCFGTSLADVLTEVPEGWISYEDFYFSNHNDYHGVYWYTIQDVVTEAYSGGEIIQIYYLPYGEFAIVDDGEYIQAQEMVITLYRNEEYGYQVMSNQIAAGHSPEPQGTELTAEQIERVNEAFALSFESDGAVIINPVCCFFTSDYASPAEISLVDFMRYFSADGVVEDPYYEVSEEEFYALTELEEWPFENVKEPEDMYVPIHGYPAETINAVLEKYTGMPLNVLKDAGKSTGSLMYLPEYDTYYNFTSDFGLGIFSCTGGKIYDGYVELYSDNAVLTLREENGNYYIYSHLPKEAP